MKNTTKEYSELLNGRLPSSSLEFELADIVIDLKKQLLLHNVSQQREPLLAYHRYLTEELSLDLHELWVDKYLKS
jgi:hypothetical protein